MVYILFHALSVFIDIFATCCLYVYVDQDGVRYAVYSRQVITAVSTGPNDVVSDDNCC